MGIEILSEIWPDWTVEEQIGEGAFGKVYKAVRNDSGFMTYAAIKVISVPNNESEVESLQADGISLVGAKSYLQGIVSDFVNEIRLMESMKGTTNIVSVEDYKVVEKKEGIGWDIFIRMELLTPLVKKLTVSQFSERDVIKLGIDICSALERCSKCNIIHRDIKPENIFVSNFGDYKIGDFGIAKQLEKTCGSLSSKGTFNYIAPEVARGCSYDARVDTYSLGIVLYKLLNNNRLPFIHPYNEQITYAEKRLAVEKRLSGQPLPPPVNASQEMAAVIDTACRYNPDERFNSPTDMKNALIRLLNRTSLQHNDTNKPKAERITKDNVSNNPGKGATVLIVLVAAIAIAVIIFAAFVFNGADKKKGISESTATTTSVATEEITENNGLDIVKPDYYYGEPLYRYVDVDDQYDGDPIRMRTGPNKEGTEKILEIPDGNYVYIHGGLADRDDWVYIEFQGNYGWVLSKYLHNVE